MTTESGNSHTDSRDNEIRTIKAEIDALQVHVMENSKPWHQRVSTVVAVIALSFSLVTTVMSFMRTADQDLRAQQVEVRSLIQRLMALPKENLDLLTRYEDTQQSIMLSSAVNTENQVLLQHAVSIVEQIPDMISAVEYYAIADSLTGAGKIDVATKYYLRALDEALDRETAVAAYRSLAMVAYQAGDFAGSRRMIDHALGIFDSDRFEHIENPPPVYRDWTHLQTHMLWAQKLLEFGADCMEIQPHAAAARELLADMPINKITQTIEQSVVNIELQLSTCGLS